MVGHYIQIMTGHYFSIAPAADVGCIEPFVLRKAKHLNILELSKENLFCNSDGV